VKIKLKVERFKVGKDIVYKTKKMWKNMDYLLPAKNKTKRGVTIGPEVGRCLFELETIFKGGLNGK